VQERQRAAVNICYSEISSFFLALYLHRGTLFGTFITIPLGMKDIERQIRLETDAVREGTFRHAKNREYQLATDLRPIRDLAGNCMDSLSAATALAHGV
jgi:hypothetical protein